MTKRLFSCPLAAALLAAECGAAISGTSAVDAISRANGRRADSRTGNSVDTGSGAFVLARQAISVQGARTLDFNISYNSLLAGSRSTPFGGVRGSMGFGWTHVYEAEITGSSEGVVTVYWDHVRKNSFRFRAQGQPYEPLDSAVRYDTLQRNTNGTWRLTRAEGTVYDFDSSGRLTRLGNKVFQFIELHRERDLLASLEEPIAGRQISLSYTRDGRQLFQALRDGADRVVYFSYDEGARLDSVRHPAALASALHGEIIAPKSIPDNSQTGLTHVINVSRAEPIGLVELSLANLSHQRPSDLTVILISPSGTQAVIRNPSVNPLNGGPNIWDLTGLILDNFDGEVPRGDWRVVAIDSAAGSTGGLNGWRMRFTSPTSKTSYVYDGGSYRIVQSNGPDGERLFANTYDNQGRVATQDDGLDTNLIATFAYLETADSLLRTTYTDRMARRHLFEHDAGYHLLSYTNPLDQVSKFGYNSSGDRTQVMDPLGRSTLFNYDQDGNLITVVDPALNTTTMTYDGNRNVRTIRDALGATSTFNYDGSGKNNLTSVGDALGISDNKTYNLSTSQIGGVLMADGGGVDYRYQNGMLSTASHPASRNCPGSTNCTASSEYDDIGRATRLVDPDGFATTISYNDAGQIVSQTNALGHTETKSYDRRGRLFREQDRNGNLTFQEYDNNDNLVAITDALGQVTRFEYDGEDRLTRTIDPLGNASSTTYDAAGRAIAESDSLGNTVERTFDAAGNITEIRDANGTAILRTTYDERGLPVTVLDALGNRHTTTYDALGRPTEIRDPLNRTFKESYDALGRLTNVEDPLRRTTRQDYERDDVLLRVTNARGKSIRFDYDAANRLTGIVDARLRPYRLTYNARDLVTTETSPAGRTSNYTYDSAGRPTRVVTSGPGVIEPEVRYSYDANGNRTLVSARAFSDIDPRPRLRREFDGLDRTTRYVDGDGNSIRYSYDGAGNIASITYADGVAVNYTYDKANRMTSVTDWAGRITRYFYDPNNRITRVELPNGTRRVMSYDAAGRILRRRELTAFGGIIVEYIYSYRADGKLAVENPGGLSGAATPPPATMSVDDADRIITLNGRAVAYDDDGNLTSEGTASGAIAYRYSPRNRLLTAGNLTYVYDEEDRLIRMISPEGTTRLIVSPGPGLSQVLASIAPNGTVTRYVYGMGLLYEERAGAIRVPHYDHRGSTVAFSGTTGGVTGTVQYGPYGEVTGRTGISDSLFLLAGLYGVITDPSNGLCYMRFRWYHPGLKRFLNQDAHLPDIAIHGSMNRFSYTAGDPVNLVDPEGEFLNALIGAVVGAAVSVVATVVVNAITGQPTTWSDIAGAAVSGAITGAILGACPPCGIGYGAFAGAAGAAAGNLTEQLIDGGPIDGWELATDAAVGGAFGAFGGGFGRGASASARGGLAKLGKAGRAAQRGLRRQGSRAARKLEALLPSPSTRVLSGHGAVGFRIKARPRWAEALLKGVRGTPEAVVGFTGDVAVSVVEGLTGELLDMGVDSIRESAAVGASARSNLNAGRKGVFGEHAHWQFYVNSLQLAGRPMPNNPNNLLSSF